MVLTIRLLARYRQAALRALATIGSRSDVAFARLFADSNDYQVCQASLALFERFGTNRDAQQVLELVDRLLLAEERKRAAELALRLATKKQKLDVLRKVRERAVLKEWAVAQLATVDGGLDEAWLLLRDDNHAVRRAAASVVWDALRPDRRDAFVSFYMESQYFFNVVRWFDRRLYAPDWLLRALPPESP